jgi:hypothetical protein
MAQDLLTRGLMVGLVPSLIIWALIVWAVLALVAWLA